MGLELTQITIRLPGAEQALVEKVSQKWNWGETIALMGASGAGKSSLLRALAGLQEFTGHLFLDGEEQRSLPPQVFRSRVVYLSQTPFFVPGTAEENIRKPFEWAVYKSKSLSTSKLEEFFEMLNWKSEVLLKDISDFSGGEQQIMALLRALLLEPQVLLLDEPTSSLDEKAAERVETLLRSWVQEEAKRMVVWVTHSKEQAQRVATRSFEIRDGLLREKEVID